MIRHESGQAIDFSVILDHIESGITVQDPTGRLVYANPAAARLIGYGSVQELLAAAPGAAVARWEMFDEDGNPVSVNELPNRRVLAGADEQSVSLRFRYRESGKEFWADLHSSPIRNADGGLRFLVTTWDDVTERRRSEDESRRLAALIKTTDDAIISKKLDGTVTSWNPGAERLFGWTAEEMVDASITRIVPDDKREELSDILRRLSRGEHVNHHETVRVTRDGRRLDIAVSISPVRDSKGRVIGAAKIARDVTARRASERFVDAFLADLAHDLNNPLAAARVHGQLLRRRHGRGQLDSDRLLKGLGEIEMSLNRVARRMAELGDVARIRLGEQLDLRRAPVDLVALAEARAAHYRNTDAGHAIDVITEEPSLVGFWDQERLERVLDNLLSNAIKYSPEGERVKLRLSKQPGDESGTDWALLTITDEGVGIPPADLPIIFDRFQRGGNVIGRFAGAGIGLVGVRQIVTQHGGSIDLESEEGAGTVVTISLPMGADE